MSGNRCEFINCGKTPRNFPGLVLHRFPVKEDGRCKKWILNSGNVGLATLSPEALPNKFIRQHHFRDSDYVTAARNHQLKKHSVPVSYDSEDISINMSPIKVLTPTKTYSREGGGPSCGSNNANETSDDIDNGTSSKQWIADLVALPYGVSNKISQKTLFSEDSNKDNSPRKRKLNNARCYISKLTKKLRTIKRAASLKTALASAKYSSQQSRVLVRMQLLHKRNSKWMKEEKEFAVSFYYKSPAAYRYLLKQGVILPSVSTIKLWIGKCQFMPGCNDKFFHEIRRKSKTMSEDERKCFICFDEMGLKMALEYSKAMDVIEGYEDFGPLGRTENLAKEALVFVARGLYSTWKLPLAYFLSKAATTYNTLKQLLQYVLTKVKVGGLIPKVIVYDGATNNASTLNSLGITPDKPYLFHEGQKIFSVVDVPHLFKSLRNNLLNGCYILDVKNINFEDIRKLYEIDQTSSGGRALLKITPKHLNPNSFQKLSVKLATQVLSRTVATALKTAVTVGDLTSTTALNTAEFVLTMDRIFDCLNTKTLYNDNPYRCALSDKNPHIKDVLTQGVDMMRKLLKVNYKGETSRPPCFDGLVQSISAVLLLHEDEKQENKEYLLTYRLNQDVVENLFSIIRQKGGYNPNPTVRVFRTTFRTMAIASLIKPPVNANCEPGDDFCLLENYCTSTAEEKNKEREKENKQELQQQMEEEEVEEEKGKEGGGEGQQQYDNAKLFENCLSDAEASQCSSSSSISATSLEKCSSAYFAGYLAKKYFDKYNCESCEAYFVKPFNEMLPDSDETLIVYRMYENIQPTSVGLRVPTDALKKVT